MKLLRSTHYLLLLLVLLFGATAVGAQSESGADDPVVTGGTVVPDDAVNEVAKDLFCPVCESTPLDVCPTQACADWRELIRVQLAEGKSREEIHEYFSRQYGAGVLADPPKSGFSLIIWLVPIAAVIVGGIFFGRFLLNLRRASDEVLPDVVTPSPGVTAVSTPPATAQAKASPADARSRIEDELGDM